MKGYTYKILNKLDGRFYVGSTADIEKRKKAHLKTLEQGSHHNVNLQSAYNCDGFDNFDLEVIYEGIFYREEEQMVLDETSSSILYNIGRSTLGGDNYTRHPDKEDIKKRTSETLKMLHGLEGEDNPWKDIDFRGELNPNWRGGVSSDYNLIWDKCPCGGDKKVLSVLCFNCHVNSRQGSKNPFFGKSHSEETKERLRKVHTGKSNKSCWVGVSIEGVVFNNMAEVAKHYQVSRGTVTHRCKSKNFPDWIYL